MFRTLYNDAIQMAVAANGDRSSRSVARVVFGTDSYRITFLYRIREAARRYHVPLANHLIRMFQTMMFSIEIDGRVTLGEGVYFVHSLGIIIGGVGLIKSQPIPNERRPMVVRDISKWLKAVPLDGLAAITEAKRLGVLDDVLDEELDEGIGIMIGQHMRNQPGRKGRKGKSK